QVLSAVFSRTGKRVPATTSPGLVSLLEAGRRGDHAVAQLRAVAIAGPVDRHQHVCGETRRLFQNVFDQADREVRINALVDGTVELADVAHHEQHLVDGSAISHGESSTSKPLASARVSARATEAFLFLRLRRPLPAVRHASLRPFRAYFLRYIKCTLDK